MWGERQSQQTGGRAPGGWAPSRAASASSLILEEAPEAP